MERVHRAVGRVTRSYLARLIMDVSHTDSVAIFPKGGLGDFRASMYAEIQAR